MTSMMLKFRQKLFLKNNGITLDVYELDDVLESTSWTSI